MSRSTRRLSPSSWKRGRMRAATPGFPRLEVGFFGWDEYWDTLRSTSRTSLPDALQVPTTWCSSLAGDLGILSALPADVAQDAAARFRRELLAPCLVYGAPPLYGLPWLVDVRVLYFWKADLPTLEEELQNNPHGRDAFRHSLESSSGVVDHPLFGLPTARDWELVHQTALLVWGEGASLV